MKRSLIIISIMILMLTIKIHATERRGERIEELLVSMSNNIEQTFEVEKDYTRKIEVLNTRFHQLEEQLNHAELGSNNYLAIESEITKVISDMNKTERMKLDELSKIIYGLPILLDKVKTEIEELKPDEQEGELTVPAQISLYRFNLLNIVEDLSKESNNRASLNNLKNVLYDPEINALIKYQEQFFNSDSELTFDIYDNIIETVIEKIELRKQLLGLEENLLRTKAYSNICGLTSEELNNLFSLYGEVTDEDDSSSIINRQQYNRPQQILSDPNRNFNDYDEDYMYRENQYIKNQAESLLK